MSQFIPNSVVPRDALVINGKNCRRITFPIPYFIDASYGPKMRSAVLDSFAAWEKAAGRTLFVKAKSEPKLGSYSAVFKQMSNGINWNAIATTTIGVDPKTQNQITQTFTTLNTGEYDFVPGQTPDYVISTNKANARVNPQNTLTHEIGHSLGLGHSPLPSSIMYAYIGQSHAITAQDVADLKSIYGW